MMMILPKLKQSFTSSITVEIPSNPIRKREKDEVIVLQDYTFNILEVSNTKLELVEVKYTPVD